MLKRIVGLFSLFMLLGFYSLEAQKYVHSVGAVLGSNNGFSYKVYPSEEVGIQLELVQKFTYNTDFDGSFPMFSVDLTPHVMRHWQMKKQEWNFLMGGGCVIGYNWYLKNLEAFKFGIDLITGFEYFAPDAPLVVQIDFRPGYSLLFKKYVYGACLDWGINVGIRYAF